MADGEKGSMDRRRFMKASAVAGSALWATGTSRVDAAVNEDIHRNERPDEMTYRKLGRTNFWCSRLVFGCGAALSGGRAVRLLERAFDRGINHYDLGYEDSYRGAERSFREFAARHRDDIWITSKAPARGAEGLDGNLEYTLNMAKTDAKAWTREVDRSLKNLGVDYMDAYYLMKVGNPAAMRAEELYQAFLDAKAAGKVGHWGISTHLRAHECLEVAIETGWYDLAMVAITPEGWYDSLSSKFVEGRGTMKKLRPFLDKARATGIGLVGMKAARHIALQPYDSTDSNHYLGPTGAEPSMFDRHYDAKLMGSGLNPYQRSYAFVVRNGMDVVNADMQNMKHFEENLAAVRDAEKYA